MMDVTVRLKPEELATLSVLSRFLTEPMTCPHCGNIGRFLAIGPVQCERCCMMLEVEPKDLTHYDPDAIRRHRER